LIDLKLFKDRTFTFASIGIFLTGATLFGTMFLLPLYYQIDRGDAAWKAGLMMAPQGIGAAVVMRLAGSLADRYGPRYVASFGMAGLAIGTFFYTTVGAHTNYFFLGTALFIRGIGLGFGMMPVIAASYRNLTIADVPKATSATNILRQIGGSLGVAIFAVVLDTQINQRIGATAGASIQNGLARASNSQLNQIARAFGHSFWWSCGTCVLGMIPALFLPRTPIARDRGAVKQSVTTE
jgi:MFS family permease